MDIKIQVDTELELLKFHTRVRDAYGNSETPYQEWEIGVCKIDDFNEELARSNKQVHAEMIPNAVRYCGTAIDGDGYIVIFEQKPQYRLFQFTGKTLESFGSDVDGSAAHSFYIPTPWVQYVVNISPTRFVSNISVYFSLTPMNTSTVYGTTSYPAPIHNVYEEGKLCRPVSNIEVINNGYVSLMSLMSSVEAEVWSSGSNMDLYTTISGYYDYSCRNPDNYCDCDEEDCGSEHYSEDDYGRTLFEQVTVLNPKHDWRKAISKSWVDGSVEYYKQWQRVPMDVIMDTLWGHPERCVNIKDMVPRKNYVSENSTKYLNNTQILTCAQNAIMRYTLT